MTVDQHPLPQLAALVLALQEALDAMTAAEDAGDQVATARHRAAAQALVATLEHRRGHQPHDRGPRAA